MVLQTSGKRLLEIAVLGVSGLVVAFFMSWLILAELDFSYSFWHDYGGIEQAIEEFGPQNNFKSGFHLTDKAQRTDLFAQINQAIHQHGEGLSDITYHVPGQPPQTLLREPEVQHLQDVANLVDAGKKVGLLALFIWLVSWMYFAAGHSYVPKLWQQAVAIGALLLVMCVGVVLVGPVKVFYWLHTVVFPEEHQWFFYYQDSLMSTMMYAPVLFGWIAIEWLALTVFLFIVCQGISGRLVHLYKFGK